MKIALDQISRDYLALRGESPDLLPLLEEGEESAVLTLTRALEVRLLPAAVQATLETPRLFIDELRRVELEPAEGRPAVYTLPADYLKLHSLQMADWKEPLTEVEPPDSLRARLGANAPAWMICAEHPMVTESSDTEGMKLRVYGTDAADLPAGLIYVARPALEEGVLTIARAAYHRMLTLLCG